MSQMWKRFGFKDTPYRVTPLEPTEEDAELFTGRQQESARFLTLMDTSDGCVVVVSGEGGIGKTSFINVHQHWMITAQAGLTPRLLLSREFAKIASGDDERSLAQKTVRSTIGNAIAEFKRRDTKIPRQIKQIEGWLSHKPSTTGLDIGLQILGVGGHIARAVSLPPVAETTLESWQEILSVITTECLDKLEVDGVIVCLDNAEVLSPERLCRIMMAFRDTLFVTKKIWWILCGQSQLYNVLDAHDRRISQRIRGPGVEIPPMTEKELYELVERRIKRYRSSSEATCPLSEQIHGRLFRASRGVARFVLHTGDLLVNELVTDVRQSVQEKIGNRRIVPQLLEKLLDEKLNEILFERRIPDEVAERKLAQMSAGMLAGKGLSENEIASVALVGDRDVTDEQYSEFGVSSAQLFRESFLEKMTGYGLLQRRSIHHQERFRLRDFAYLCNDLKAFDQAKKEAARRGD